MSLPKRKNLYTEALEGIGLLNVMKNLEKSVSSMKYIFLLSPLTVHLQQQNVSVKSLHYSNNCRRRNLTSYLCSFCEKPSR